MKMFTITKNISCLNYSHAQHVVMSFAWVDDGISVCKVIGTQAITQVTQSFSFTQLQ